MTISRGRAQAATGQAGKHEPLTELAAGIGATLVSRRRRSWQWTWLLPLSNCTPPGEKERGWELQSSSPTPTSHLRECGLRATEFFTSPSEKTATLHKLGMCSRIRCGPTRYILSRGLFRGLSHRTLCEELERNSRVTQPPVGIQLKRSFSV